MSITLADMNLHNDALLWNIRKGLKKLEEKEIEAFRSNLRKNKVTEADIKTITDTPLPDKYQPHDVSSEVDSNNRLLEAIARTLKTLPKEESKKIVEAMKLVPGQARSLNARIMNIVPKAEPSAPELPPLPGLSKKLLDTMLLDVLKGGINPAGGVRPPLWFEENAPPPPMELPVDTLPKTPPLIPDRQTSNIPHFLGKKSHIRE